MTFAKWFFAILVVLSRGSGQVPTYSASGPDDSPAILALRHKVASGDRAAVAVFWDAVGRNSAPLFEPAPGGDGFSLVTFLWRGGVDTRNVTIFDGVAGFDAKDQMQHLDGSDVWYKTYRVRNDARFAYNLSPNDSLQPFDEVKGDEAMRRRLAMLQVDPLNPRRCPATFGDHGAQASYVELRDAPGLVWGSSMDGIRRGHVVVTAIHSGLLKADKKLWVYTPAGFAEGRERYPLLVVFDGDRNEMRLPQILDVLIAQRRIPPIVAIMTDESIPSERRTELPCNPRFADFLAKELVPWSRQNYHATTRADRTIVYGSSFGGLASTFAGLQHPEVFGNVVSLSGSFWWKPDGAKQGEWLTALVTTAPRTAVRFYLEAGLMESYPMQVETNRHMRDALMAKGYEIRYAEYDGGHSFLNWSGGIANGLEYLIGRKLNRRNTQFEK